MADNYFDRFDGPASQPVAPPPPAAAPAVAGEAGNYFDRFDAPSSGRTSATGSGRSFNIDWSRPVEEVRSEIAKLPEVDRPAALRQWADTYVANERGASPSVRAGTHLPDLVRNVARGTIVGSFLDEANAATQAGLHSISGGRIGAPYDEAVAYQRATDRAIDAERPITSTLTQIAGGLASARPFLAAAKTLPGRMAIGAPVGAGHGFVYGYGSGEGDLLSDTRLDSGLESAGIGAVLGGTLPIAISGVARGANALGEAVSPTVARWRADLDALRYRYGIHASADGGLPATPGADAAALQVAANDMRRSGRTVGDLRAILDDMDRSRTFHSSGVGQNVLAPVDLDVGLQRLAASAIRQSPEAAGIASTFDRARQTGLRPVGRQLEPNAGLPVREALSVPMTGRQAEQRFGTRFDTPDDKMVPGGQGERLLDYLKRALRIEDEASHGHGRNAYRTEQAVIRRMKTESDKLYPQAWREADDFDLTPAFDNLRRAAAEINDPAVHGVFRRAERLFQRADGNGAPLGLAAELQRFDVAKQRLDGLIDRFRGRDSFLYRALTRFKQDLLDSVHGGNRLEPIRNKRYSEARDFYSSQKEAQEAIAAGRAAFRGDSDAGADAFLALETEGLRKLFRLGLHSEAELAARTMKVGADKTQLFDNPRIQDLLAVVIPRSKGATAEFADRPERFGRVVGMEQRMVQTRNTTLGGSQTARNIKDDDAFAANNALTSAFEKFRQSGSLLNIGLAAVSRAVEKVFGMRNDVAVSLVRQLYTADPASRARFLADLEARMGSRAMERFVAAVREASQVATPASIRQATQFDQPQR